MTTVSEMVDVDADLGTALGTEGGTKKMVWKTRYGAGDVVALNVRSGDSVGEEGDCSGVARCHSNILVRHQAVKRDGSNKKCQEQGMPPSRVKRFWRRREQ